MSWKLVPYFEVFYSQGRQLRKECFARTVSSKILPSGFEQATLRMSSDHALFLLQNSKYSPERLKKWLAYWYLGENFPKPHPSEIVEVEVNGVNSNGRIEFHLKIQRGHYLKARGVEPEDDLSIPVWPREETIL